MEFLTDGGEVRAFEITYAEVDARTGTWTYRVEDAFTPWMQLELQGWPGGIDHRTCTDMLLAFRSIALCEWASDEEMRWLRERRRAELAREHESA